MQSREEALFHVIDTTRVLHFFGLPLRMAYQIACHSLDAPDDTLRNLDETVHAHMLPVERKRCCDHCGRPL